MDIKGDTRSLGHSLCGDYIPVIPTNRQQVWAGWQALLPFPALHLSLLRRRRSSLFKFPSEGTIGFGGWERGFRV